MNFIINLLVLCVSGGFAGAYLFSLILNIVRAVKVNKEVKNNPLFVIGSVAEVQQTKNRVYVKVEYYSDANGHKFVNVFELTKKEFNDQYYEGQEVRLYYADTKNLDKVNCFPVYLEGQKQSIEAGPLFTDIILFAGGVYVFVTLLMSMLTKQYFEYNGEKFAFNGLMWNGLPLIRTFGNYFGMPNEVLNGTPVNELNTGACSNGMILFIYIIFYFMLTSYLIERISGMSSNHKNDYLKLCGVKGTAEVKTFKFSKSKDNKGNKESQLKIEFFTNSGEKIETDLSSYLYSETQEQFIDILYDPKNPKNVVYVRK